MAEHLPIRPFYLEAPISRSYSAQEVIRLLDSLPEAYFLFDDDPHGRLLHTNPAFNARLAEEPQRERLQQAVDQMVEDLASRRRTLAKLRENGGRTTPIREVRTARGRYVLRGSFLGDSDPGSGVTVLISMELIAAEPLSEQALRERFGLTPRESEVARLIVEGKSNLAIANAMGISPHTAHHYTERVLLKIGVRSRGEVAARALGLTVQLPERSGQTG